MSTSDCLRQVENIFRDVYQDILAGKLGSDWINECGVPQARIGKWRERSEVDEKCRGRVDPRLIYYADFYDLRTILRKSWDKGLHEIFIDLRETDVLLKILEEFRNQEAHHREFLPFEVSLIQGISGSLRSKIVSYYSKMRTSKSVYPQFELAQDSLGNAYAIGQSKAIMTNSVLQPGDFVEFKLVATDPLGDDIEYIVLPNATCEIGALQSGKLAWTRTGNFAYEIKNEYVGRNFTFRAAVRSNRQFHAERDSVFGGIDDQLYFRYEVLPPIDQ